jgi:hypothetical protein
MIVNDTKGHDLAISEYLCSDDWINISVPCHSTANAPVRACVGLVHLNHTGGLRNGNAQRISERTCASGAANDLNVIYKSRRFVITRADLNIGTIWDAM